MNKIIFAIVLSLSAGLSLAQAQVKSFGCAANGAIAKQQAQEIIAKVQAHYASIDSLQGGFRQDSYVAALDEGELSSGEMVFAKPGKMRWSYKQPRAQEVVVRDGELWIYQPDKEQVMIDDIRSALLSALPISFMMGLGNLNRDFELVSACRSAERGVVLKLKPRSAGGAAKGQEEGLEGFDLLVDQEKNIPNGAKITSVGGNVTAIVFENLVLNRPGLDSSRFVLEYPKGVDILDRRAQAR
ncbi:MAG: LolA family protein [Pseudomonadota bacterium]|jgi:outer membrane lipoprotein carrier protein